MKDGNFYQIAGWMGNRLGLRGNELICFAIIYGFSQDGESQFNGNLNYLSDFMFCSKPTAMLCLEKLIKLDLIRKEEAIVKGKKRCYYSVTVNFEDGHLEYIDKENTGKEPLPMTGKEPLPVNNNNSNNNNNKKWDNNKSLSHKKGDGNSRFVKPTIEQVAAYIQERGLHFDAEHFFDYYESKGWMIGKNHMKDWKAACRTWEHQRNKERNNEEESQAVDESEMKQWGKIRRWLHSNAPRIAERISYDDFKEMKKLARDKSEIIAEIIKEIDQSYFNGNNLSEFYVLAHSEKYRSRIEE